VTQRLEYVSSTSSFGPYRYSIPAVLDPFFIWLESTSFSVWMRESPSLFAFPLILAAHTIGLGLLAGVDVAHDLRILGAAPKIPIEFDRYLRIMWFGLAVNAASGVALLIGYPTKALTNPVFYLKLSLIAVALVLVKVIRRRQQSCAPRLLATLSLLCWAGAIVAGRLLAYTYTRLDATS
jgi:hypothetical protein